MTPRSKFGLCDEDRRMLDRLVLRRLACPPTPQSEPSPPASDAATREDWTDFRKLPGYRELELQRSAAAVLGLDNPFFHLHETCAGATARIGGRRLLNFASYDYLGLNQHLEVRAAAHAAIDEFGASASASRLVAGERPGHRRLEQALAKHYGQDDCVAFVSGYATNVSTISAIVGPKDLIVHDVLDHNSILAGAALSGAERRSFPHNDCDALDAILTSSRRRFQRALIIVEGLYSMDGDVPDLPRLVEIKRRHDAWLMVDDAHGLGVLGARGHGAFEHAGIDPRDVDIWMGTLSKTLASCGGFIAGAAPLVEYLKCMSGGFVYSVGLSPPLAAAALAAYEILLCSPERVEELRRLGRIFLAAAKAEKLDVGTSGGHAIIPIVVGDSIRAVAVSQELFRQGVNVRPIIHPAVPERSARLRFFLSCDHSAEQIREAVSAVARAMTDIRAGALGGFATVRGE